MSWPPPNYAANAAFGTGYKVTLSAFRQLIKSPSSRTAIAPLLKTWFGYDIVDETLVRSSEGQSINLEALHTRIQNDPQKQYELYQAAMELWH
jgi:hypothetical protein